MSMTRHHAEWLSLLEISGPFLSVPVLLTAFPQGLEAQDPDHRQRLRAAYEEWLDDQGGLTPDPAIHHAWVQFVLQETLELPAEVLADGPAIPEGIKATLPEHGETLRPDGLIHEPESPSQPVALWQVYPPSQDLQKVVGSRHWKASPATRMMTLLHQTGVRVGLVTNGEQWLLVQAQAGEMTGFISWYANLWLEEPLTLRAFRSLLGVTRFFAVPDDQTLPALLSASADDQHDVTDQLGAQVRQAVEILIQAIDRADQDRGHQLLADLPESLLYEAALTVMMRLVFLLTAEERDLLLLGDPLYDQHYAASTLRGQLREQADQHGEAVLERGFGAWQRLLATFRAVYGGIQHETLRLPAYGGSLFDPDRFPFLEGRTAGSHWRTAPADPLPIDDRTVLHLLEALQVLRVPLAGGGKSLVEARRLSFRALDIEQIGHVYEGLLDHQAVRATEPVLGLVGTKGLEPELPLALLEEQLAQGEPALIRWLETETKRSASALKNSLHPQLDPIEKDRLRAACGNDPALYERVLPFAGLVRADDYDRPLVVRPQSVYVTSGATRRATGTHYTPRTLTEPIVQHTLEPLVYEGPAQGLPREQWRLRSPKVLLGLRVCDMAMGSGAFLVQACRYLSERLVEAWAEIASPLASLPTRERGTGSAEVTPNPSKEEQASPDAVEQSHLRMLPPHHIQKEEQASPDAVEQSHLRMLPPQFVKEEQASPDAVEEEQADPDAVEESHLRMKESHLRMLPPQFVKEEQASPDALERSHLRMLPPHHIQKEEQASPDASGLQTSKEEGVSGLQITPDGTPATGDPRETILPDSAEERLMLARRLVADRCLYGVDKNPLAVEMGKLSLWLITLDKHRPFTFLDHALRHGDSLVGADEGMFLRWAHSQNLPLFDQEVRALITEARQKRQALQAFTVQDVRDAEEKARLLAQAEAAMARVKLGCDLLVGVRLLPDLTKKGQADVLANGLLDLVAGRDWQEPLAQEAVAQARAVQAFHWPFEFPEVFADPLPINLKADFPSPDPFGKLRTSSGEGGEERETQNRKVGGFSETGGGFSAFVGNPPFIGGQRIRGAMGDSYYTYVKGFWNHKKGSADYSAYFFLRGYAFLRTGGTLGLIATNTIAQGATLEVGLEHIHEQGGQVYRAYNDYPWPGQAAVVVNIVHQYKGEYDGERVLDDAVVENITPALDDMAVYGKPYTLQANAGLSHMGTNVVGIGFVLEPEEAQALIANDPKNKDVLFPYLNGSDLNSHPRQEPSRWVINFFDWPLERTAKGTWQGATDKQKKKWLQQGRVPSDYSAPIVADYQECLQILRERVYPIRIKNKGSYAKYWWRYGRRQERLYKAIAPLERVLSIALTSKTGAFAQMPTDIVFSHATGVIAFDDLGHFAILQSNFHIDWAWQYGSSLKGDLRYTPRDVFETFPFPDKVEILEGIGQAYHQARQVIMLNRQEGLTKTYNRFHDPEETAPDIVMLRGLHKQMDERVAEAYGWASTGSATDLDLGHGFHETAQGVRYTISEPVRRKVLTRLLQLNHRRYEEEVLQGLHDKKGKRKATTAKKKKKPATPKKDDGQLSLF